MSKKPIEDLTGQKINKLTVIKKLGYSRSKKGYCYYECLCDCGKTAKIRADVLKRNVESCGCTLIIVKEGYKVGKLTVISKTGKTNSSGNPYWNCRCDCGKFKILNASRLYKKEQHSCGCSDLYKRGSDSPMWTGYAEIHGNYWAKIKQSAEIRNLQLLITKEYIWELFLKQERKCALSGIFIQFENSKNKQKRTASLDRIDSSKGYVEGNVQWVHKKFQAMKMALSQNEFINNCKEVAEYQKCQSCES